MKKLLIEVTMKNSLKLVEDNKSTPRKGCLGTMKGICADYKNPTRNGNFYSRKLWENVFNDPLVKESLEDKVLLGEVDHPLDDRLETQVKLAAIVMTDYEFDDSKGVLVGSFDILDTPQGKILKSLLDYGCKIGVSSRGEGDVTTKDGVNYVSEEGFNFVGFDAVALPAVKSAKPALQESLVISDAKIKSFKESLLEQINSSITVNELKLIENVINSTNLPEPESLLNSVNIKMKSLEASTSSSNLIHDLEESMKNNNELRSEISRLKEVVATSKTMYDSTLSELNDSKLIYEELMNDYKKSVFDSSELNSRLTSLEESHRNDDKKSLSKINYLMNENSTLRKTNKEISEQVNLLEKSNRKLSMNNKQLTERLDESNRLLKESRSNLLRMKESGHDKINTLNETIEGLQKSRRFLNDHAAYWSREAAEYKSQLDESRKLVDKKSTEINKLTKSISNKTSEVNQIKNKLNESNTNNANNVKQYALQRAREYGINPNLILESVNNSSTIESVNSLLESIKDRNDRYSKLPITIDSKLSEMTKATRITDDKISEEDQQTMAFLNSMYKG